MIKVILQIFMLSIVLIFTSCNQKKSPYKYDNLRVTYVSEVIYKCATDAKVLVKYYSLSDSRLSFIKIKLPNKPQVIIPQSLSGSGAKYSNKTLFWWTKDNKAFVKIRAKGELWQFLYKDCQVIKKNQI